MANVDEERQLDDNLEGEISSSLTEKSEPDETHFNTLDEPVKDTILRDLRAIGWKFFHVLYPKQSKLLLKDWDLWGPLVLCVFLAIMLQGSVDDKVTNANDGGPEFAQVFVIYWLGASVVTLNIKLLGGSISFFQSVCVLGYCVLPLAVTSLVGLLLSVIGDHTWVFVVRCVLVLVAFGWSVFASTAFLADCQPAKRKPLAVYPIFLFYFFIGWLVLSHKHN